MILLPELVMKLMKSGHSISSPDIRNGIALDQLHEMIYIVEGAFDSDVIDVAFKSHKTDLQEEKNLMVINQVKTFLKSAKNQEKTLIFVCHLTSM